jgi:hypothetical protein
MAVITLAEYKTLNGITSTDATRDARITALIPEVEAYIVEYCNNAFTNPDVEVSGTMTTTAAAGPVYTLDLAAGGFTASGMVSGDDIAFTGSKRNDGRFTVSSVADTALTVVEAVTTEGTSFDGVVKLVQYPNGLKLIASRMISYQLDHMADAGMQSENIGKYSYSKQASTNADGYPDEILKALNKWRNVRVLKGLRREHYNDRRGSWVGGIIEL